MSGYSPEFPPAATEELSTDLLVALAMAQKLLRPLLPVSVQQALDQYLSQHEPVRQALQQAVDKVEVIDWGSSFTEPEPDVEVMATVKNALFSNRQLRIRYVKVDAQNGSEFSVHPVGLVERGGKYYLVVWQSDYKRYVQLVLNRIKTAQVSSEAVESHLLPLQEYIAEGHFLHKHSEEKIHLKVRVCPAAKQFFWERPALREKLSQCDGGLMLEGEFDDSYDLRNTLLTFGDNIEVLEPIELRNAIIGQYAQDILTGCFLRREFDYRLGLELSREKAKGALILFDIDHFKQINDTYGHSEGDRVLKQVARLIREQLDLKSGQEVYRWGGEEFAVILAGKSESDAQNLAEKIRTTIEKFPFGLKASVTLSGGVTGFAIKNGVTVQQENIREHIHRVCKEADGALYDAKQNGRNRIVAARSIKGKSQ